MVGIAYPGDLIAHHRPQQLAVEMVLGDPFADRQVQYLPNIDRLMATPASALPAVVDIGDVKPGAGEQVAQRTGCGFISDGVDSQPRRHLLV